jgi:predicted alpha/beta hydrolase family esterase
MRQRIVYIHGDHVLSWRWKWVTWLEAKLREAGFQTFFELFPDSIEARAKYWMPFMEQHIPIRSADVLLGWSCGAVAAMRYAEKHPIRGLVLIAPYYTDLGMEEVRRSGFVTEPWQWPQVRGNAGNIAMFCGDNDPYISQVESESLAKHLRADVIRVPGAGHFAEQEEFKSLFSYLLNNYGNGA